MRTRKVVDEPATLHSALLELSTAFELEPELVTEGGADAPEGAKKSGGGGAAAKCSCCQRPCKCGTVCGIYGCTLPNRHTGMCELPDGGTCSRRRSLTTRTEIEDPLGEPFEELTAGRPPLAYAGEGEEEDAVMGDEDDDDEGSQPTQCERHPLCIRGFKHCGMGGRCSLRKESVAGSSESESGEESSDEEEVLDPAAMRRRMMQG